MSALSVFFQEKEDLFAEAQSVEKVIEIAHEWGQEGDVVLLSPACASFDLFKNYEDRGDQFRAAVKQFSTKTSSV